MNKRKKFGFTLIELLVVIAVIGVMVTAVVTVINPIARIQEARDSTKKQNLQKVVISMEACFAKHESYTYCDTQEELQSGTFLQAQIADVQISAGCCAVLLEAPPYPSFPYWRYTSAAGKADYAPSGC